MKAKSEERKAKMGAEAGAFSLDDLACVVAERVGAPVRSLCVALLEGDLYEMDGGAIVLDHRGGRQQQMGQRFVREAQEYGLIGRDMRLTRLGERVGRWLK